MPHTHAPRPRSTPSPALEAPTAKSPVQLRGLSLEAQEAQLAPAAEPEGIRRAAAHGVRGGGGALPQLARVQAAFGRHDVGDVRAHVGGKAADACGDMNAEAYATGSSIAFAEAPDLHTVAHEAAHVVQQRAGVSVPEGVGASGDRYERQADEVADAVVAGAPAEPLLDRATGGAAATSAPTSEAAPVQRLQSVGAFREATHRRFGARDRVNEVEAALAAYHQAPAVTHDNVGHKQQLAAALVAACRVYEALPDAKRVDGVFLLRLQAQRAERILGLVQQSVAAGPVVDKWRLVAEARDLDVKYFPNLGDRTVTDWSAFVLPIANALPDNPADRQAVLATEVAQLEAIRDDYATLPLLRNILTEVLANVGGAGGAYVREGRPGARRANEADQVPNGEAFTVEHNLDAPLGTSERLASLTHELTHVSVAKKFDNSRLFLAYAQDATDEQILELSARRTGELEALDGLLQTSTAFDPHQRELVQSKVDYPHKAPYGLIQRYLAALGPDRIGPALHARLGDLAAQGLNNSVVEYDTVINQMMMYMHSWRIPAADPFYTRLRAVAQDAFDYRNG